MRNFMGRGNFVWWTGVVEDRNDPVQMGRVKVRCFGYHTEDKNERQKAFRNLVKRNHIPHISLIDYLGDIQINKSHYQIKPKKGIIEVYLAALPVKIKDNQFIEK